MHVSDVDCLSSKSLQALQPRVSGSGEAALVASGDKTQARDTRYEMRPMDLTDQIIGMRLD